MKPLPLPLALVLCDLEDDTGKTLTEPGIFSVLLAASMLAELDLNGRLRYHDGEKISLLGGKPTPLLECAELCLSARPMLITKALQTIASLDLRHTVHSHLVGRGALKVTTRTRFFWFKEYAWTTADPEVEDDLRDCLRGYVECATGPVSRPDILLALLDRGGLLGTIWEEPPLEKIRLRSQLWPLRRHLKAFVEELASVRMTYN